MDGNESRRMDRLEAVLRAAHARREAPPVDPAMADSVLAAIKAAPVEEEAASGVLWRMAAGAGFVAAATVLLAMFFGTGLEEEIGRMLFYDPNGQVLVSMLGV
ncbi:hypothetical protein [Solidesulfovibrio sp.]|uniref:hypothetical protein n=1 Tax=Solidesulfovibrio sp. TaxID=2910990 RepID=UPI0026097B0B|nr:hypothetical protein [Solidesulfovibrio sp.]